MFLFFAEHKFLSILLILFIILTIVTVVILTPPYQSYIGDDWVRLNFDVKRLKLNTTIDIYKNDIKIGYVSGNIIRLITDPLTYYDTENNAIAFADDSYHLIAQDSHSIKDDIGVLAEITGKVKVLGELYDIYDGKGRKLGSAEFDHLNINGKVTNNNNQAIAIYRANPITRDFTLSYSPRSNMDEKTLIMLCACYYSDYAFDEKNKNNDW